VGYALAFLFGVIVGVLGLLVCALFLGREEFGPPSALPKDR
jgi:hypothetical protein